VRAFASATCAERGRVLCRKRRELRERLAAGDIDILIGTTALNNDDELFASLGLVVIDEQHRFGVRQRAQLVKKDPHAAPPHVLFMTATPIPRTIAMTLMSHMTTSALDELPPGRLPVECGARAAALTLPSRSCAAARCLACV
jgi:ATP-dependent DNA helicase RecG